MRLRDFNSRYKAITAEIVTHMRERTKLSQDFRRECPHLPRDLVEKVNYYEDEYGKSMESWTDYNITCKRCQVSLVKVKRGQYKNIREVREAIKRKAAQDD